MSSNILLIMMIGLLFAGIMALSLSKSYYIGDQDIQLLLSESTDVTDIDVMGQTADPNDLDFNVDFQRNQKTYTDPQEHINDLMIERQDILEQITQLDETIGMLRQADSTDYEKIVNLDNERYELQQRLTEIEIDIQRLKQYQAQDTESLRDWQQQQAQQNKDRMKDMRRNTREQQQRLEDLRRDQQQRLKDLRNQNKW